MSGLQEVDRIAPVRPTPSLLTSARDRTADGFGRGQRTVEVAGETIVVPNWTSGIAWNPTACAPSHPWPRCPEPDTDKEAAAARGEVATDAFMIYTPMQCDWQTEESNVLEAASTELTDTHTAFGVAGALWLGEGLPETITLTDGTASAPPTLRRSATDLALGELEFSVAVAELLRAYEECTGGNGGAVLHVPSILVPYALGAGDGGGTIARTEGNLYRGPLGSVVSPGPGYPSGASVAGADGFGPLTDPGPPEQYAGTLADQAWIYVTGPVEYALGTIKVLPEDEASRRLGVGRANLYEVWAERFALVRFDPCCVFAQLVATPAGATS